MGNIGDPMTTAPPTVVNGQPKSSFWTGLAKYFSEVSQRLQSPLPPVTELGDPAAGGTLNLSGTLSAAVAAITGALSAGSVAAASAIFSGALSAASVATAEGDIRHGQRKLMLAAVAFTGRAQDFTTIANFVQNRTGSSNNGSTRSRVTGSTSPSNISAAGIPLSVGDRIISIDVYCLGTTTRAPSMSVWKNLMTAAAVSTQIGTTHTGAATATQQKLSQTGLTEVIADETEYWIEFLHSGSALAADDLYGARIIYDRP